MSRSSRWRKLLRGAALAIAAWLFVSGGVVLSLRWIDPPFTSVMLSQPGSVGELAQTWVSRDAIDWNAARAVIASEDQRFAEHHGIDFNQLNAALADFREGEGLRGASTITQQVAKNLFLWQGRSLVRKGLEAYFALSIELFWSKERILEVYLNVAEFGPGVFGVEAAAGEFFGISANSLSIGQAALLAAVLPNPERLSAARPSEYVRVRQAAIVTEIRLLESRGHYLELAW